MPKLTAEEIEKLLRDLRLEAREHHRRSLPSGTRLSESQRAEYRSMMKDYRSLVRMEEYPPQVERLADRVLTSSGHVLDREETEYREFCMAITSMLAQLYADLLADDQG